MVDVKIYIDGAGSQDQVGTQNPDSNGAPSYINYVEFINENFSVYDKQSGSSFKVRMTPGEFWHDAGIVPPPGLIIDPRIVFIPDAGRNGQWLAVQLDQGRRVMMATTSPLDPLADPGKGKWKGQAFSLPGNDFTMLGYDATGVYIGSNCGSEQDEGRSPYIVIIPRSKALAYPPQVGSNDIRIIGPLSKDYGYNLYPAIDQTGAAWPVATAIGVDNVGKKHLTFSLISMQSMDIVSHGMIEVEPFQPLLQSNIVKQPDPLAYGRLVWGADGIITAPMSDGFNIWVAQTVLKPDDPRPEGAMAVRWYRLYIDPVTRIPGLARWGEIAMPNYDFFNPSILSFGKDDYTVISLSRSGGSLTPKDPSDPMCGNVGAYVALVLEKSEAGTQPPLVVVKSGQAPNFYAPPYGRWGDYSTIFRDPDPALSRRVWIVNQYVKTGGDGTSQWCDAIAAIDVPPL